MEFWLETGAVDDDECVLLVIIDMYGSRTIKALAVEALVVFGVKLKLGVDA